MQQAYQIKRQLTDAAIEATDCRAQFIGLEAYEAAGGHVLRDLAVAMCDIQRRNFYQLRATVGHRGRYCHEYSMVIDTDRDSPALQAPTNDAEDALKEVLRDLARWLYRQLEHDYDHLNSDGEIEDAIAMNGYRFRADGLFHG